MAAPRHRSLDPELRFRAFYNLGLAALLESRARHHQARGAARQRRRSDFREALLLAARARAKPSGTSSWCSTDAPPSGGGGGIPPPTPPPPGAADPAAQRQRSALSQAEAEQILNSVDRTERDVRADQARRRRVAQSAAGKDW